MTVRRNKILEKIVYIGLLILLPNSGYLIVFDDASYLNMLNVFVHVLTGVIVVIPFLLSGRYFLRQYAGIGKELAQFTGSFGYYALAIGLLSGILLAVLGSVRTPEWIRSLHIFSSIAGIAFLIVSVRRVGYQLSTENRFNAAGKGLLFVGAFSVCIPLAIYGYWHAFLKTDGLIHNPHAGPMTMAEESIGGEEGPFYPSSLATRSRGYESAGYVTDAETCGQSGCHEDILRQWSQSSHRFSGFDNLWYRESIKTLADSIDTHVSNWCAGCHTPALLVSGQAGQPFDQQMQREEAQHGVTCNTCHAVTEVSSTMGQADFILEEPTLLRLASHKNSLVRKAYALFVHLDSEPHRRSFSKPFHRQDRGKFCSACHKGHVDEPVNRGRWLQIMNDYDSWQNSSFSGKGTLESHAVDEVRDCVDCHMPFVRSDDVASKDGRVRFHGSLARHFAGTPDTVNESRADLAVEIVRDSLITLDIFAIALDSLLTPAWQDYAKAPEFTSSRMDKRAFSATIVDDQENRWPVYRDRIRALPQDSIVAPIDRSSVTVARGTSFRIDLVVKSRGIGHHFPAGAVDMNTAWIEFSAVDNHGHVIFASHDEDGKHGSLHRADLHVYGAVLVDSAGQRVFHNESWKARSVAYIKTLPPNSAEVVRYHLELPPDCGDQIELTAVFKYSKFGASFENREELRATNGGESDLENSTGLSRRYPVVEMARSEVTIRVDSTYSFSPHETSEPDKALALRWNDYGLGLMQQGDLVNAAQAFEQALKSAPLDPDIWINSGIILLSTDRIPQSKGMFRRALAIREGDPRAQYYLGMANRFEEKNSKSRANLKRSVFQKRRDRELRIELGRIYYEREDYRRSIRSFKRALRIDPEDAAVYFYMMHTYQAEGKPKSEARVRRQFLRFRRDDSFDRFNEMARERYPALAIDPNGYHEHWFDEKKEDLDKDAKVIDDQNEGQ